ncbi:hypothetical protein DXG01_016613, partial [Tephrocybe rancida]
MSAQSPPPDTEMADATNFPGVQVPSTSTSAATTPPNQVNPIRANKRPSLADQEMGDSANVSDGQIPSTSTNRRRLSRQGDRSMPRATKRSKQMHDTRPNPTSLSGMSNRLRAVETRLADEKKKSAFQAAEIVALRAQLDDALAKTDSDGTADTRRQLALEQEAKITELQEQMSEADSRLDGKETKLLEVDTELFETKLNLKKAEAKASALQHSVDILSKDDNALRKLNTQYLAAVETSQDHYAEVVQLQVANRVKDLRTTLAAEQNAEKTEPQLHALRAQKTQVEEDRDDLAKKLLCKGQTISELQTERTKAQHALQELKTEMTRELENIQTALTKEKATATKYQAD